MRRNLHLGEDHPHWRRVQPPAATVWTPWWGIGKMEAHSGISVGESNWTSDQRPVNVQAACFVSTTRKVARMKPSPQALFLRCQCVFYEGVAAQKHIGKPMTVRLRKCRFYWSMCEKHQGIAETTMAIFEWCRLMVCVHTYCGGFCDVTPRERIWPYGRSRLRYLHGLIDALLNSVTTMLNWKRICTHIWPHLVWSGDMWPWLMKPYKSTSLQQSMCGISPLHPDVQQYLWTGVETQTDTY